jgi:DNA-binding transcriptional ArsR family regulator
VSDVDGVFAALADGTRRTVMQVIAQRGGATATELAAGLPVTRQAVAKHLAVLEGAGLVHGQRAGRERRFSPTPAPLGEAISWMASVGAEWDDRLAALQAYASGRPSRRSGSR